MQATMYVFQWCALMAADALRGASVAALLWILSTALAHVPSRAWLAARLVQVPLRRGGASPPKHVAVSACPR